MTSRTTRRLPLCSLCCDVTPRKCVSPGENSRLYHIFRNLSIALQYWLSRPADIWQWYHLREAKPSFIYVWLEKFGNKIKMVDTSDWNVFKQKDCMERLWDWCLLWHKHDCSPFTALPPFISIATTAPPKCFSCICTDSLGSICAKTQIEYYFEGLRLWKTWITHHYTGRKALKNLFNPAQRPLRPQQTTLPSRGQKRKDKCPLDKNMRGNFIWFY